MMLRRGAALLTALSLALMPVTVYTSPFTSTVSPARRLRTCSASYSSVR